MQQLNGSITLTFNPTDRSYEINQGGCVGLGETPASCLGTWLGQIRKLSTADQRTACNIAAETVAQGAGAAIGGEGGGAPA